MAKLIQEGVSPNGWIYACLSKELKKGVVRGIVRSGHRIALWRTKEGKAISFYAKCPHMGADLSHGKIENDHLTCPLHGWAYGSNGQCEKNKQATQFIVIEKYGAVFIWWGNGEPLFAFPESPCDEKKSIKRNTESVSIQVHPILATVNGFDLEHLKTVHNFDYKIIEPLDLISPCVLQMKMNFIGSIEKFFPATAPDLTFQTFGVHICILESKSAFGHTWHILANYEEEVGQYKTIDIVLIEPRFLGTGWLIALFDQMITNHVLEQDRYALANWEPDREVLTDSPWPQYLEVVDGLKHYSPG